MQSRIDRLEGLVLSLMSGNSNNINASPRNRDTQSSSSGAAISYPNSRDGEGDEGDDTMGYDEHYEHDEPGHDGAQTVEDEVEEVRNALGVMKVNGGTSCYRGETHWAAILSGVCQHIKTSYVLLELTTDHGGQITEVKKYFEETKQKYESEIATMRCRATLQAAGFPFSAGRPPSMQEILDLVPKQPVVDQLVDCFFGNHDPLFRT